jgi:hypothetical protein
MPPAVDAVPFAMLDGIFFLRLAVREGGPMNAIFRYWKFHIGCGCMADTGVDQRPGSLAASR